MSEPLSARPQLAVGAVLLQSGQGGLEVCLIRRAQPPQQGRWSLPGGRVEAGERLAEALRRELREETGLDVEVLELLEVVELIGEPHYVVLDYLCERRLRASTDQPMAPRAGDDAAEVAMVPVAKLHDYGVSAAVSRVVAVGVRARSAKRPG